MLVHRPIQPLIAIGLHIRPCRHLWRDQPSFDGRQVVAEDRRMRVAILGGASGRAPCGRGAKLILSSRKHFVDPRRGVVLHGGECLQEGRSPVYIRQETLLLGTADVEVAIVRLALVDSNHWQAGTALVALWRENIGIGSILLGRASPRKLSLLLHDD